MTKDQIIAMARTAGAAKFVHERDGAQVEDETNLLVSVSFIERFASLVAAQAAAEEREECAKVCESFKQGNSATYIDDDWADMCAAAIRERK